MCRCNVRHPFPCRLDAVTRPRTASLRGEGQAPRGVGGPGRAGTVTGQGPWLLGSNANATWITLRRAEGSGAPHLPAPAFSGTQGECAVWGLKGGDELQARRQGAGCLHWIVFPPGHGQGSQDRWCNFTPAGGKLNSQSYASPSTAPPPGLAGGAGTRSTNTLSPRARAPGVRTRCCPWRWPPGKLLRVRESASHVPAARAGIQRSAAPKLWTGRRRRPALARTRLWRGETGLCERLASPPSRVPVRRSGCAKRPELRARVSPDFWVCAGRDFSRWESLSLFHS